MYGIAALIYLLLCFPVVIRLSVGLNDTQNSLQADVSYLGLHLCFDAEIRLDIGQPFFQLLPRYGKKEAKKRPGKAKDRFGRIRRLSHVLEILGQRHCTQLYIRLGLGDAAGTAIAAGACRMLISLLCARLKHADFKKRCVEPDFDHPCFLLCFQSIFSASPGDIMFAAIKTAFDNRKREGSTWKSIPLKV